jgi:hypothetical protein
MGSGRSSVLLRPCDDPSGDRTRSRSLVWQPTGEGGLSAVVLVQATAVSEPSPNRAWTYGRDRRCVSRSFFGASRLCELERGRGPPNGCFDRDRWIRS